MNDHKCNTMPDLNSFRNLLRLPRIDRRSFMRLAIAAGVSSSVAASAWQQAAAATKKKGGRLRLATTGGATTDTMDGATLVDSHNIQASWMARNNLTEVDANGEVFGELAESWEPSADAKTWVFRIRKGVEFHSGKSLTVQDVIQSINHHRGDNTKSGGKGAVASIESITADGKDQLIFKLGSGNADFPYLLADYHLTIAPAENSKDAFASVDGTGPYVLKNWEPGVRVLGERNPNYFKTDAAFFDEVENLNVRDATARQTALQAGDVDAVDSPNVQTLDLLTRFPGVTVHEVSGTKHFSMPMLSDTPPFDNNHVRLALKSAIDRQAMLDIVLFGRGYLGNDHPVGKNQNFFAAGLAQQEYDPDLSRYHLRKAGLSNLKVQLHAGEIFQGATDSAVLFAERARVAGIEIEVVREASDGYWSNVWKNKPFCVAYWSGRSTADWMLSTAYQSTAAWNDSRWKNEKFDQLLLQARAELNNSRRAQMYFELQGMVKHDGAVIIPVFANYILAVRDTISTPAKLAGNWGMDGYKAAERWWQA